MRRRRSGVLLGVIGALVVLGAIVASGVIRRPTGESQGGPIAAAAAIVMRSSSPATSSAATSQPAILRLASFNIHSGVGRDGRFDLRRTADVLRGRDLIGLNEVAGGGPWWDNNARTLATLVDRTELFAPAETRWWRPSFGNAALTDRTIAHWHVVPLRRTRSYRNALLLDVPLERATLHVLITHAGRKADNGPELDELAEMFEELPKPAVLMGDLNAPADDPGIRRLIARTGAEDPVGARTAESYPQRIDYILLRGVRWTDAGLIDGDASDHPMVWVDIDVAATDADRDAAPATAPR
jgi:endonuclease/exonuclease/phosphatase family metal-dependent hydrolase